MLHKVSEYSETCAKDHLRISRDHLSIKTTRLGPKSSFAIDFDLYTESQTTCIKRPLFEGPHAVT